MTTPAEIFNKLVLGESSFITIKTGTLSNHNALRTRLVKLFSAHKTAMQSLGETHISDFKLTDLGLCATFDSASGHSTFSIAIPTSRKGRDYEIVDLSAVEPSNFQ